MSKPHYTIAPLQGYPEPYGTLLATLEDSSREWRGELWNPDQKSIIWQAVPQGHSVGAVLLHIAEVEAYWIEEVCLGRALDPEESILYMSAEIDQDAGIWPVPPEKPIEYYYDLLDKVRARTLESVKSFGAPDSVVNTRWGTMTLSWVLAHVIEHDSYHGGQAVLLNELAKRLGPK